MPVTKDQRGQPEVWALLTLITFPIVLIATDLLGVKGLWPFGFAVLATFGVLTLEAIVRGRLWPFEDRFLEPIAHPATPFRILLFLGATLLVLETLLIFAVTTDRRFDPALIDLVIRKECGARQDSNSDMWCRFLSRPHETRSTSVTAGSLTSYAIRAYAATSWFPKEDIVTCAERNIEQSFDTSREVTRQVHLVHCTAWNINEQGRLQTGSKKTAFIGGAFQQTEQGDYRVVAWTEDPNSEQWKTALGGIAEASRDRVQALAILPEFENALHEEARVRAEEMLDR